MDFLLCDICESDDVTKKSEVRKRIICKKWYKTLLVSFQLAPTTVAKDGSCDRVKMAQAFRFKFVFGFGDMLIDLLTDDGWKMHHINALQK